VRIDEGNLGVEQRYWPVVNMAPSKHRAYAVQWFAMAAAVLIIVLLTNTNFTAWLKQPRAQQRQQ
jgi:cytochrome oxidase assembly protein ShyY1